MKLQCPRSLGQILIALVVFLSAGSPPPAQALTPIEEVTWEQRAERADFAGIVECVTAGGFVARYRVVESWRGPEMGTELTLYVSPDRTAFPIALCGEKFVVMADRPLPPPELPHRLQIEMMAPYRYKPLSCRRIPADYYAMSRDPVPSPVEANKDHWYSFARFPSFTALQDQVRTFLKATPTERERRLLLAVARQELHLSANGNPHPPDYERKDDALYQDLLQTKSPAALVERLIVENTRLSQSALSLPSGGIDESFDSICGWDGYNIILKGGGKETRACLEKLEPAQWPWDDVKAPGDKDMSAVTRVIHWIDRRLQPQPRFIPEPESSLKGTTEDLKWARAKLNEKPPTYEWNVSFDLLARHDPVAVVDFLVPWRYDPRTGPGYHNISAFALLCEQDRRAYFVRLLAAADPTVRVGAAVYLCFEDLPLGMEKLRTFTTLEGDPGAWAALVLATRGEKTAVSRALVVFERRGDTESCLQARLRVLLSNSAQASGVPQPPKFEGQEYRGDWNSVDAARTRFAAAINSWWTQNADKISLTDPWLKTLDAQKVD
ncbi:MAG: hypothetical protein U0984_05695 [Prosthecobacter sp.]|nr:hypothetical protein [Prosthecobacter sp.]